MKQNFRAPPGSPPAARVPKLRELGEYTGRALGLVWGTSHGIALALLVASVVAGVLPAAIAYVGKCIVDAVVEGAVRPVGGASGELGPALGYVALELVLVLLVAFAQRGLTVCDSLLRAQLGQRVNELILEKALTLQLSDFEDSDFYDRMTRARREASSRPLSLVRRVFGLGQNAISLLMYGGLLLQLSGWTTLGLVLAAIPAFVAEKAFSDDAFRLSRRRAPEARMQSYLESLLAREDHAKEVTLFRLGPLFLARYRSIFERLFREDRALTLRRGSLGFALGTLSTLAFYAAYGWIVVAALERRISLGDMTMYLLLFKQGQSALSSVLTAVGGMYEDNLYLSNLYEYLEHKTTQNHGTAERGPHPEQGLSFENVSFAYDKGRAVALEQIDLRVLPGEKLAVVGENGAGKTTLIKLLTRLYEPTEGVIKLDGLDLREWNPDVLRRRVSVIFQDFIRYQLKVGENIGVGDVDAVDDPARRRRAARQGMADSFIDKLPLGYETQLGRWFAEGQELSVGQWQRIALSRAFMREDADILVLDEPTSAMDAEAESEIFRRFRELAATRIGIVISHRFSTVRMADQIVVLQAGRIVERGSHEQLMAMDGRYARLFNLQADGYR